MGTLFIDTVAQVKLPCGWMRFRDKNAFTQDFLVGDFDLSENYDYAVKLDHFPK